MTIQFTVSDANLDEMFLYIDNSVFNVTGTTSYSRVTTTLGDGGRTIRLVATDRAGNSAEKSIAVFTVNVMRAIKDNRNTYLATGLIIGALIVHALLRRKKSYRDKTDYKGVSEPHGCHNTYSFCHFFNEDHLATP